MNFKTGTPIEHALYQVQLPRPAIKAYEAGFLNVGPVRAPGAVDFVFGRSVSWLDVVRGD